MNIIEIKNLNLKVPNKTILEGINLDIKKTNTTVIIGESGSGKTTLARLLIGFQPKLSDVDGEIIFSGKNILDFKLKDWLHIRGDKIAFIAQNPMSVFSPLQKIKEDFLETYKSHKDISDKEILDIAVREMKKLNLKDAEAILEKYPFELSGGMLQRIMVAMILGLEPDIIIADEPTSALDYANSIELIKVFAELRDKGSSLLIITHDYIISEKLADEIVILKDGKIHEIVKVKDGIIEAKSDYGIKLLTRSIGRRKSNEDNGC